MATDLPPFAFAAVAGGKWTSNMTGILIDINGEWNSNGLAVEIQHPSFHATEWQGGGSKFFISLATDLPPFAAAITMPIPVVMMDTVIKD